MADKPKIIDMTEKPVITKNGNKITETYKDSSVTYTENNPNLDSAFGRAVPTPKATAKATPKATAKATPKATVKATPTPTAKAPTMPIPASRPKGSQAGHAVTDNNNHTRTVK